MVDRAFVGSTRRYLRMRLNQTKRLHIPRDKVKRLPTFSTPADRRQSLTRIQTLPFAHRPSMDHDHDAGSAALLALATASLLSMQQSTLTDTTVVFKDTCQSVPSVLSNEKGSSTARYPTRTSTRYASSLSQVRPSLNVAGCRRRTRNGQRIRNGKYALRRRSATK